MSGASWTLLFSRGGGGSMPSRQGLSGDATVLSQVWLGVGYAPAMANEVYGDVSWEVPATTFFSCTTERLFSSLLTTAA